MPNRIAPAYRTKLREARRDAIYGSTPRPELVFHYTSAEKMFEIVKPRENTKRIVLWASSAFCMNDPEEIIHGAKLIHRTALEFLPPFVVNHSFTSNFETNDYTKLMFLEKTCIASFCSGPDLLSQWRIYGKNGDGYSIGFRSDALAHAASGSGFDLVPVIYDPGEQEQIVRKFFISARHIRESPDAEIDDSFNLVVISEAVKLSFGFKNKSFHEEQEWRLVSGAPLGTIKYRGGRRNIIPYVELDLDKRCIGEIWLGPTLDKGLATRTLEMYLRAEYGTECSRGAVGRSTIIGDSTPQCLRVPHRTERYGWCMHLPHVCWRSAGEPC